MLTIECGMCENYAILGSQKCIDLFVDRRQTSFDPLNPRCYNKNCVHCNNPTKDVEYEVSKILSFYINPKGKGFYLILFKGYDKPSWEPVENLTNCPRKLTKFWKKVLSHHPEN